MVPPTEREIRLANTEVKSAKDRRPNTDELQRKIPRKYSGKTKAIAMGAEISPGAREHLSVKNSHFVQVKVMKPIVAAMTKQINDKSFLVE